MLHLITSVALRARLGFPAQTLLFGATLGWVAWELSRVAQPSAFNLMMAVVVLAAGSASGVLYALHNAGMRGKPTRSDRVAAARNCLSLLGCGIALAINGLQLTLA